MTVNHVMLGKCQLCHDTEHEAATLGWRPLPRWGITENLSESSGGIPTG